MDSDSLTSHDTVYDNAYDTDDNVYDVYYDVHEEMDVDYGDGPWPDRINHSPTGHGRVLSLGNSHSPCPCLVAI